LRSSQGSMKSGDPPPLSQEPATSPYPNRWIRSTSFNYISFNTPLNKTLPPTPRSSYWSLSSRFSYQNPECPSLFSPTLPINATCPAHVAFLRFIVPIFGDEYKLWSSSLCNFLNPRVNSFLGSKYSPLHPLLKPLFTLIFSLWCERPSC
jgi:hypothetical protein